MGSKKLTSDGSSLHTLVEDLCRRVDFLEARMAEVALALSEEDPDDDCDEYGDYDMDYEEIAHDWEERYGT